MKLPSLKKAILGLAFIALVFGGGLVALAFRADIPAAELEKKYTDADSQFLDIAGSRVHFKDVGAPDRPALLLIHGTASSLHTWDGWAQSLGEHFRILRLDLPGYGLTGANAAGEGDRGDYSIRYRLEVIDGLMQSRGIEQLAVAGNSLGGLIAWRYAAAFPERVQAAVLVNAAGAPRRAQDSAASEGPREDQERTGFRVIDLVSMPVVSDLMTRLTPRFLFRDALHQVYADPSKVSDQLIDRHYDLLLREGNRRAMVEAAAQRTLTDPSPRPLGEISQPMLVMWGQYDRWIPVADADRFHAELPNSELVIYDNAGHVPMEEIPEESAADTLDFLQRHYLPKLQAEAAPGTAEALAVARQEY